MSTRRWLLLKAAATTIEHLTTRNIDTASAKPILDDGVSGLEQLTKEQRRRKIQAQKRRVRNQEPANTRSRDKRQKQLTEQEQQIAQLEQDNNHLERALYASSMRIVGLEMQLAAAQYSAAVFEMFAPCAVPAPSSKLSKPTVTRRITTKRDL